MCNKYSVNIAIFELLYIKWITNENILYRTHNGIKIAGININNLSYADDTTLMAESQEELNSLLMKVRKESEKNWLKI